MRVNESTESGSVAGSGAQPLLDNSSIIVILVIVIIVIIIVIIIIVIKILN